MYYSLATACCLLFLMLAPVPAIQQLDIPLTTILDNTGKSGDSFGSSLSTFEGFAVIGSPPASHTEFAQGFVTTYHYNLDTGVWIQDQRIFMPIEAKGGDIFGHCVFLFRPTGLGAPITLLSSAIRATVDGRRAGLVSIFQLHPGSISQWDNLTAILAFDPTENYEFGFSVAGSGDTIVISDPYMNSNGSRSGTVYLSGQDVGGMNAWGLKKLLYPSDATAYYGA